MDCIAEQDLDEMNIEIIRNTLHKAYLEAFYEFCQKMGGYTADVMCEILAVRNKIYFEIAMVINKHFNLIVCIIFSLIVRSRSSCHYYYHQLFWH